MSVAYPPRLNFAQLPTPLDFLERLSEKIGGPRIWVKRDEKTGATIGGNKIRKLEFTLARALDQGCDTIITCGGIQSNHCRATAIICAQLGLHCHLILRGQEEQAADGNFLLDRLVGAQISFYTDREYQKRGQAIYQEWEEHYRGQGKQPFSIPVGASDGIGIWGYIAACEELADDFADANINPEHIVCATGSGGTQAGLIAGNALWDLDATISGINVCDDEAYFHNKIREDLRHWQHVYPQAIDVETLPVNVIDGYVGAGYARASADVFDTIKMVARMEGVIFDPVYTGKAFHGLLSEISKGHFDDCEDVVFIHTGGIFGLFPQREQFQF